MKRIIIDCDPGIDDAQAIMMAYRNPGVQIEAITTVSGNVNVNKTTANALKILDVLNAGNIPVFKGASSALVEVGLDASNVHGADGLGDCKIPESIREINSEHAALALIRLAKENRDALTLVAIGPLTNVALALKLEPDLPSYYKNLVIMGGAYLAQGNTVNHPAEFNIFADPDAAYVVFDTWPKFTMISWEATVNHSIPFDLYKQLFNKNTPTSIFIEKISGISHDFIKNNLNRDENFMADPLAMAVAIAPEIVLESEKKYVQVERYGKVSRGMTVIDWYGQSGRTSNVEIIRQVDFARFIDLYKLAFT